MSAAVALGSVEYLFVPMRSSVAASDLDGQVSLAVIPDDERPDNADWISAAYDGAYVRALLPGTHAVGRYIVWVKVDDLPEHIVRRAGTLVVY